MHRPSLTNSSSCRILRPPPNTTLANVVITATHSRQSPQTNRSAIRFLSTAVASMAEEILVAKEEVHRFVVDCMVSVGTDRAHAKLLADALVMADHRGHYSHGINRLDIYTSAVKSGTGTFGRGTPKILNDRPATAWVDGCNLLGPVVGQFCMDLAIGKAKQCGIGMVVAKRSNHYGIAGFYSMQAMEHGMLGLSFTNATGCTIAARGKKGMLGTNPISLAVPGQKDDSFVLDMATSTVAYGKVEIAARKGVSIPEGWAVDENGKSTTDPTIAKSMIPLGGSELTSGYKGYGLCVMVECLTSILGGATPSPMGREWTQTDLVSDLGQCFIAIDLDGFAPGFEGRMQSLMNILRTAESADGETLPVLVPGDPERQHMEKCDRIGGILYHVNKIAFLNELAGKLNVKPLLAKQLT